MITPPTATGEVKKQDGHKNLMGKIWRMTIRGIRIIDIDKEKKTKYLLSRR